MLFTALGKNRDLDTDDLQKTFIQYEATLVKLEVEISIVLYNILSFIRQW
jgi:hypothetical protein